MWLGVACTQQDTWFAFHESSTSTVTHTCAPCGVPCTAASPIPEPGCASSLSTCVKRFAVGETTLAKRNAVTAAGSRSLSTTQGLTGRLMHLHERSLVRLFDLIAALCTGRGDHLNKLCVHDNDVLPDIALRSHMVAGLPWPARRGRHLAVCYLGACTCTSVES